MTTLTAVLHGTMPSARPTRPSIVRRVLNAMIESRQREAQRHVNSILLDMDDSTLAACGYSRQDLLKGGTIYRTF